MKIRCSSLGKIMTNPRSKSESLSATCKSYIKQLVKEDLFNYRALIGSKEMDKGTQEEDNSILLYNSAHLTSYVKNDVRLSNDYIQGECDINGEDIIIDIKSSWSLETFPASNEDIDSKAYEWQLRGYMWLYEKPKARLAYCMVSTPDHLLKDWDNLSIHKVDHIDPVLRVSVADFERDIDLEYKIAERVMECREYYEEYKQLIINK